MKKMFFAMALATAPLMAGCSAIDGVESVSVVTDKAMYGVEALYNVPAHAYVTADGRGQISTALKAKIKPKLQNLESLLLKARDAKAVVNLPLFNLLRDQMKPLSAELSSLIPSK